jgi:CubicO group peptidase (beta-lactamase class C family)
MPLRGYHEETKHTKDAKKKSASSFVIFVAFVTFVPASAATSWQRDGERPGPGSQTRRQKGRDMDARVRGVEMDATQHRWPVWKAVAGAVAVLALSSPAWSQQADADLNARLERLAAEIERGMDEHHVPGSALAIVRNGQVIFARGFGLADVERRTLATPETPFFIGSTTKAFTATLVGMLVDDGLIEWDDPVEKYLPFFTLAVDSKDPEARVTIRDLLSHRTGFPRMGMLWANGALSQDEILRQAANAEPLAPFRQRFHYNNVQYLAAGTAAAAAAGDGTWNALIEERILKPLGMNATRTSVREARANERTATGYAWDGRLDSFTRDPASPDSPGVDSVGPAGSISSTAIDMAHWIRFLLAGGVADGRSLIGRDTLRETWSPQIQINASMSYGLGWMVSRTQGQPLFMHGGDVPGGFSTIVALLPESDLGFVFLTNALQPLLPALVLGRLPEILLGAPPAASSTAVADAGELGAYVGRYVANFGNFANEVFTVIEKDGRLALDIPSQREFVLNPPNDRGLWQFALTDQIAISFNRDDARNVVGLTVHQAGMAFEAPREGVAIKPEIDLTELERYLGEYRGEAGLTLGVVIQNQRLALQLPNDAVLDLNTPGTDGRWTARANAELGVAFDEAENGTIAAMNFYRPGGQPVLRLVPSERTALPSVDEIMALRGMTGAARRAAPPPSRSRSRIRFPHAAVEGEVETIAAGDDRLRIRIDLGRFGEILTVLDGNRAWTDSSMEMAPLRELSGEELRQTQLEHPAVLFGDWRAYFDKVDVIRAGRVNDRAAYAVRLTAEGLPDRTVAVDAETGDVLRIDRIMILPGDIGRLPVTTTYGDFREVDGVRVPFRSVETNEQMGRTVFETLGVEHDVELPAGTFAAAVARTPGQ